MEFEFTGENKVKWSSEVIYKNQDAHKICGLNQ